MAPGPQRRWKKLQRAYNEEEGVTETLQEGHRDLHQQQTVLLPAGENFSIQSHCELHSIGYKSYSLGMDFQKPDKNK